MVASLIVRSNFQLRALFDEIGEVVTTFSALPEADRVVFTGGGDIDASIYGQPPHESMVGVDITRDRREIAIFRDAVERGIPMIGICRGAQLLNILNGGSLIQDVDGHRSPGHHITTNEGETIWVSSTHHQMMLPNKERAVWLAWAEGEATYYDLAPSEGNVKPHFGVTGNGRIKEPEVIWYPETLSLCVQYHPEYMAHETRGRRYFLQLIEDLGI